MGGRSVPNRAEAIAVKLAGGSSLAAIMGLALALRLYHLGHPSLWVDEAVYLRHALNPLADLVPQMLQHGENHPPLYFALLHAQLALGRLLQTDSSLSEGWIRLPSVIFGVAAVGLVYLLANEMLRERRAALVAAGFMAISTYQVMYSQEARMYAMAVALGLASTCFFWRAMRDDRGWTAYTLATAACAYTYYLTGFCWLAQLIAALSSKRDRAFWRKWMLSQVAAALLFLPWVLVFRQMSLIDRSLMMVPGAEDVLFLVLSYAYGNNWALPSNGGHIVGLLLALPVLALALRGLAAIERPAAWLLAGNVVVPAAVLFVLAHASSWHLFIINYLCIFQPYLIILAAAGLTRVPKGVAAFVGLVVVGVNLYSLSNLYFNPLFQTQDWRSVGVMLTQRTRADEVVIVQPSMFVLPLRYYYRGAAPLLPLDDGAGQIVAQRVAEVRGVWLVTMPFHPIVRRHAIEPILDAGPLKGIATYGTNSAWEAHVIGVSHYSRDEPATPER